MRDTPDDIITTTLWNYEFGMRDGSTMAFYLDEKKGEGLYLGERTITITTKQGEVIHTWKLERANILYTHCWQQTYEQRIKKPGECAVCDQPAREGRQLCAQHERRG